MKNSIFSKKTLLLIFSFCSILVLNTVSAQPDTIFIVDKQARFPGGDREFARFWSKEFKIPYKYRIKPPLGEGKVHFLVAKSGEVKNIRISQSLRPEIDDAALAAARKMPKWEPAIRRGQAIEMEYEFSFFVLNETQETGFRASRAERDSFARKFGWGGSLWAGTMIFTNDFGAYFNPLRVVFGLEYSCVFRNWEASFGFDAFAFSKVKKPFEIDGIPVLKDYRFDPVHVYFSIGHWFDLKNRWKICPYFAPTINIFDVKYKLKPKGDSETLVSGSFSSGSLGFRLGKEISLRRREHFRKSIVRYETDHIGLRFCFNPQFLNSKNTTQLRGSAITLAFNYGGWVQRKMK